uniref:Autophagy-related protein 13 n=1 Tax=Rhabditophanes sp. KR3021 TaxID=114890 RepID=A0AC35TVU1_9BILA
MLTPLSRPWIHNCVTKFMHATFQILVQSRDGPVVGNECIWKNKAPAWFQIEYDEIGSIAVEMKRRVKNFPQATQSVNIDFIVNNMDGVCLPLEQWRLTFDEEGSGSVQCKEAFHDRLTLLLRSVIVASRVTPCHRKYVRHQSLETFVLTYKVYEGDFTPYLGGGAKYCLIGETKTSFGNFSVECRYRTELHEEPEITSYYDVFAASQSRSLEVIDNGMVHVDTSGKEINEKGLVFEVKGEDGQSIEGCTTYSDTASCSSVSSLGDKSNKNDPDTKQMLMSTQKSRTDKLKLSFTKSHIFMFPIATPSPTVPFESLLTFSTIEVKNKSSNSIMLALQPSPHLPKQTPSKEEEEPPSLPLDLSIFSFVTSDKYELTHFLEAINVAKSQYESSSFLSSFSNSECPNVQEDIQAFTSLTLTLDEFVESVDSRRGQVHFI